MEKSNTQRRIPRLPSLQKSPHTKNHELVKFTAGHFTKEILARNGAKMKSHKQTKQLPSHRKTIYDMRNIFLFMSE